MLSLLIAVAIVLFVSFLCSMAEAALYSVSWTTIEKMRKTPGKEATGDLLFNLRLHVDKPIAAILTLNTVANTAGATIAGAIASTLFSSDIMPVFAGALTLLILAVGEIIPKTVGVVYAASITGVLAKPLKIIVTIFTPFIYLSGLLTRLITRNQSKVTATEDDIRAITSLTRQAGIIQDYEEHIIRNILSLDLRYAHEIMTPRTIVFSLPEETRISEAYTQPKIWNYSRIPVYGENNEDIVGVVMRKDIAKFMNSHPELASSTPLTKLMQPVRFVLETTTAAKLLIDFLNSHSHLVVVLDEYGGLAGVVSLEDVLEEMLGQEIVDETDDIVDLRAEARRRRSIVSKALEKTAKV